MNKPITTAIVAICIWVSCTKPEESKFKPRLFSFEPMIATADEPVKISGVNFSNVIEVRFGGIEAMTFKIISDSVIFAYPGLGGASGMITLKGTLGTAEAGGFTYYVPQSFQLLGTAKWSTIGIVPPYDSANLKSGQDIDSGSVTIRRVNRFDTPRLRIGTRPIPKYTDSADKYVMLYTVVDEPYRVIPGDARPVSLYKFTAASIRSGAPGVFAKIKDTLIEIPRQYPHIQHTYIEGSGTLKGNKMTLKYTVGRSGDSKSATLTSQ